MLENRKPKHTLLLFLFFFAHLADGQDRINLFNGKVIRVDSVAGRKENEMVYFPVGNKEAETINVSKIFSIIYANGTEDVFYIYDSLNNGDMTVPHMRSYIMGRRNAAENYHAPTASIGGIVFGGASAILGLVYGPVPIAMYCLLASKHYPNVAHQEFSDINMLDDTYYLYGYQIKAKRKKLKNAFVASAISFGISFMVLVKNNRLIDKELNKRFGI